MRGAPAAQWAKRLERAPPPPPPASCHTAARAATRRLTGRAARPASGGPRSELAAVAAERLGAANEGDSGRRRSAPLNRRPAPPNSTLPQPLRAATLAASAGDSYRRLTAATAHRPGAADSANEAADQANWCRECTALLTCGWMVHDRHAAPHLRTAHPQHGLGPCPLRLTVSLGVHRRCIYC
eukprot:TRINITY_DN26794_c0_g1_i5.p1 TRINITY_DN26794_c0_g1~~TRINITY_DN26794_c0_g1_i5.p1  ORF type:complete len:196 (+),score=19.25 TRINITY_DN26794_c0_g1_i5:42-590(+)